MKRTLAFLLISLSGASGLYAQAPTSTKAIFELVRKRMAVLGPAFTSAPSLKGAAAGERVSAEADYNDDGNGNILLTDSARFIYSGARHSKFDYNGFQYIDLSNAGTGPDFLFMELTPNNFDSSGLPLIAFDTLHHYIPDPASGKLYRKHTGIGTFNADISFSTFNKLTLTSSGALISEIREVIVYNAGRMVKAYGMQYFSGVPDTNFVRSIVYDGAGNMLVDSLAQGSGGILRPSQRNYYIYNAAGLYTSRTAVLYGSSGIVDTLGRFTNTYYANGQLRTRTVESQGRITGILQPGYKDSLTYTAGVPGYTGLYEEEYDDTGAVAVSYRLTTDHLTGGKKDSVTLIANIGGVDHDIISLKLHFDAAGNPVDGIQYDLQNATPGNVIAYRNWYYEPINTGGPAGVKPTSMVRISIAPNPTTGIITLRYPDAKPGTPIFICITNASGQPVHSEAFTLQGTSQQILLGQEAVPGTYYLSVYDVKGRILCTKSVLKL